MKAMILTQTQELGPGSQPLLAVVIPNPSPKANEVLVRVHCCGVCHTELDEIEGRTPPGHFPRILGHQVVGTVERCGKDVSRHEAGDRVGVAWIFSSCGTCEYCRAGNDNLCPKFQATGRDADGGYAEYMAVPETCAFKIPEAISDLAAAPLLCAGAIGYRALRLTRLHNGQRLGLTGFGASAHLMMKMIAYRYPDSEVYVFARQAAEQAFARSLGAVWAGGTEDRPPALLHAIVDTTPAWLPVLKAMESLLPGGRLVINAIRKEATDRQLLLDIDYERQLWMEKELKTVANVSRRDVREFLDLAAAIGIEPEVTTYPLEQANQALLDLKFSPVRGAKVLLVNKSRSK